MAGELAFFEIGVEDTERGRAFYEGLFGWKFEPGPSPSGFVITAPNMPGGMHGGDAAVSPYMFFAVDDLEVEGREDSIAKFGRLKLCSDDQGSGFGPGRH